MCLIVGSNVEICPRESCVRNRALWRAHVRLLQDLATGANLKGFNGLAAEDLTQAPCEILVLLQLSWRERRALAALSLCDVSLQRLDLSKVAHVQRDSFVHMLITVCSMAGDGDRPG